MYAAYAGNIIIRCSNDRCKAMVLLSVRDMTEDKAVCMAQSILEASTRVSPGL